MTRVQPLEVLPRAPEATRSEQRVNILIVDDRQENLLALEAALAYLDQNLVKATSGKEALKLLLRNDFAVILLDVHMPDMDGFEAAALIRDREKSQHIPIIFLTAMHKGERQVFRGYSLGAVDYIFKPFEPEILKAKVSVFIELYKKTEEVKRQARLITSKNQELDHTNRAIIELLEEIEKKNNELELRVQERTSELKRTNEALSAEVAERQRAEEERTQLWISEQQARQQAEAANRSKDEFLATVSHELRTPLNAILGWARLLRSDKLDETAFARGLETIERNAKSQAKLIEDILDVSRIISGKLHLESHPIVLPPVIEMAMDAVRPAAEAKAIRLQTAIDSQVGKVRGDPNRLQQVVWNLLANAVKFTPNDGEIRVCLESSETHARIVVSDNGKGIAADFLPFVFDRFSQAESHSTRRFGGLGLGLAIARHLIEMHGGTIRVESAGENQGATFIVELPFVAAEAMEQTPPEAARHEAVTLAELPAEDLSTLRGVRILLVDDDADTLQAMSMTLSQIGADVQACASAPEAFRVLRDWDAQLVVSDLAMPEEDGYALLAKVQALAAEEGRQIPAIAVTAFASEADRRRVLSAGFQMHVSKPVEPFELATAIAQVLRNN